MQRFQRLLLVVNPVARTVSKPTLAVLEKALSADFKLEVVETAERGHATELAREAGGVLTDRALAGVSRRIHLGVADGRYFAVNCGAGVDAAAMARLERKFPKTKGSFDRAAFVAVMRSVLAS